MTSAEIDQMIGALRDRDGDKLCLDAADTIAEMTQHYAGGYDEDGLFSKTYPLPIEHYERAARNLANLWSNGNDGARVCILAALLRAATPADPTRSAASTDEPAAWEVTDSLGMMSLFFGEDIADDHIKECGGSKRPLVYAAPTTSPEPNRATLADLSQVLDDIYAELGVNDNESALEAIAKLKTSPEPDAVREALEAAEQFIVNGVDLNFIQMPDDGDPAHETLPKIQAALRALARKDGEGGGPRS